MAEKKEQDTKYSQDDPSYKQDKKEGTEKKYAGSANDSGDEKLSGISKFLHGAKAKHENEELRKKVDKLTAENAELVNTLQRLQAEFENYRKRTDKENAAFRRTATSSLVKKLIPILETLELALKSQKNSADSLSKGVLMVYNEFKKTLESEGLKSIEAIGKKFDPNLHDVMLVEETQGEDDMVLEEMQRGYIFQDCVLRHSKVKISRNSKSGKADAQQSDACECEGSGNK